MDCPPTGEPDFKQIPEISNTWMNGERGPSLSFFQPSIPHYNTDYLLLKFTCNISNGRSKGL
ncbi:uncharacterized protein PGTG_11076 [Puccinia graminis f. sp. tritici CRL 75-36-700-3]|uniref:Uncharacterized protein n=1 Tax=Puccinia graminis f. sp. tritici (strain CRL 75-36-700-3 / race SCCL) TaxID=418459 RepID=E3KNB1_PUCGT|nr:uncharacterized protein PGTG_11076 [Puccinia graminis f. sp. tritici CRL 75-36-700-3]EFP85747.1 hypothetical protein PGTG_11076 [Puccinia graminis f. sp. tritici CRL 75-36-700-3]